jgi:hypothetical protein
MRAAERLTNELVQQTEKPAPKSGLFDANAGDYLISHTLTRAVPSARRGLTSVFGMGTGVTLAVNSPASLGAALGGRFPAAISLHTRAVSPRNETWQTGATKLAFKNELHWDWLQFATSC